MRCPAGADAAGTRGNVSEELGNSADTIHLVSHRKRLALKTEVWQKDGWQKDGDEEVARQGSFTQRVRCRAALRSRRNSCLFIFLPYIFLPSIAGFRLRVSL